MPNFPTGWSRTPREKREKSQFRKAGRWESTGEWDATAGRTKQRYTPARAVSFSEALAGLQREVERAGGRDLRIDQDGGADIHGVPLKGRREPDDPGVVVYWARAGKQYAIACDRYVSRAENLRAIAKTIEATRGIERWGAVTAEQAYRGYEALPPPGGTTGAPPARAAHDVLGVQPGAPANVVRAAFNALALQAHPDRGGSVEAFRELVSARDAMLGGRP